MGGACSRHRETRNTYGFWLESLKREPLGISRCRREDRNKMGLTETGLEGVDWINMAQDMDRLRLL
jgi:hypothetical protein